MNEDSNEYKQYLDDKQFIKGLTNEIFGISNANLPVGFDFEARQTARPITLDDINNLKITLNVTEDVNEFLEAIN